MTVDRLKVSPELYQSLNDNYAGFKNHALIACHDFTADWNEWEQHPLGDEIVVLLSGKATMVLLVNGTEEAAELTEPGSYVVVPSAVWHTAKIDVPTKMLFITPGEGTKNAKEPASAT